VNRCVSHRGVVGVLPGRRITRFIIALAVVALLIMAPPRAGAQESSENAKNGKQIYTNYGCYECHGREGQGSILSGPRIGPHPTQFSAFVKYIRQPNCQMPPYTEKVASDAELADIYAFLQSLPEHPDPKSIPLLNSEAEAKKVK